MKPHRSSPRRKPGSGLLWILCLVLIPWVGGCSADHKASTGRTQREADSVLGESNLPGAHVVKRATATQDSARAAAAALDTVGTGE